jgi:hypothetical protein
VRPALFALLLAACGGGSGGGDGGAGQDLSMPSPICTCGVGTSCLRARITRAADDTMLPWKAFAGQADGKGTLVGVARPPGGGTAQRQVILDADLAPASAQYDFDFGCVAIGTWTMNAFLDDNGNAGATDLSSADYRDACLANRATPQEVRDAAIANAALVIASSCD